ncbi:MAG: hypothetical protein MJA29_12825, partial [Candidatus Omnitrophica bacterium]|nr:hypothetical protein [Candidatus Omnitrophota bacterium]
KILLVRLKLCRSAMVDFVYFGKIAVCNRLAIPAVHLLHAKCTLRVICETRDVFAQDIGWWCINISIHGSHILFGLGYITGRSPTKHCL